MDEHDDRHQGDPSEEALFRSGRVRIVGAEPVRSVGDPDEPEAPDAGLPAVEIAAAGYPADPDDGRPVAELPHWTDAPTGEVPAVLARANDDDQELDPWSSLPAPTWREEHADWQADEESFEPSMLAQDDLRIGALDDSGATDRQPWTFELEVDDEFGAGAGAVDEDTIIVPAVRVIDEPGPSPTAAVPRDVWPQGTPPPAQRPMPLRERLGANGPGIPEVGPLRLPADGGLAEGGELAGTDLGAPFPDGAGALGDLGGPGDIGRAGRAAGGAAAPGEGEGEAVPRTRRTSRRGRPGSARSPIGRPVSHAASTRRPARPRAGVAAGTVPGPRGRSGSSPTAGTGRDLPVAIMSGLAVGALALVCFDIGTVASLAIVTALVTLAAMEALAAFRRGGYHPATLLGLVAVISLMVATYNKGEVAVPLVAVLLVAFVALWHVAGVERGADPVRSAASTLLVFCWIGIFGSYGALLLAPSLFPDRHGIAFLLGAVIAGVAYDVGALAVGATMGSHPIAPSVSPNKTWEGALGGLAASVLAAVLIVHLIHPWTVPKAAALGVVVAVVSPIGDLTESLVKRHLGLKDMSRLLPGHGGVLDRVDGLLFVLPATFYLVKALHLG
jgi:phosphatidate cytidylyltransferase